MSYIYGSECQDKGKNPQKINNMNWYLQVLKKYAVFSGRARRKEYWMYTLFCVIFGIVAMIIDNIAGTTFKYTYTMGDTTIPVNVGYGYIYAAYGLATFIPGIAVGVRRLHDVGKSGWFYLLCVLPLIVGYALIFIGIQNHLIAALVLGVLLALLSLGLAIWLLVLFCTNGTPGENKYGPNPKEIPADPIL